jgi:hypothetical protein
MSGVSFKATLNSVVLPDNSEFKSMNHYYKATTFQK